MDWVSTWRGFFVILDSSGHLVGGIGDGSTFKSVNGKTVLTDNLWHCVAIVFDRSANVQIFVDGLPKETLYISALVSSNVENAAKMRVGSTVYGGNYFNGVIDEVRIYGRVLSTSEIQVDFNAGPDSSANVLAKVPKGNTGHNYTFMARNRKYRCYNSITLSGVYRKHVASLPKIKLLNNERNNQHVEYKTALNSGNGTSVRSKLEYYANS